MDSGTTLRQRAGVVMRPEEDEAFLFDPDRGTLKLLNATGVEVWALLDGTRDAAAITAALCAAHPEAAPDAVVADVGEFLDAVVGAGLAEAVPREP